MKIAEIAPAHPPVLYHHSARENRASILRYGLQRRFSYAHQAALGDGITSDENPLGGIFFSTKPQPQPNIDVWAVDVRGVELDPDDTTDPEDPDDHWLVTYEEDIPANRLRLMPP